MFVAILVSWTVTCFPFLAEDNPICSCEAPVNQRYLQICRSRLNSEMMFPVGFKSKMSK